MGDETSRSQSRGLEPDPYVLEVRGDVRREADESKPKTRTLQGWLGESDRPGAWRLYLTPELDEYLEVLEDDIIASHPLDKAQAPLGGTVLNVRSDAEIQHVSSTTADAAASLLGGGIVDELLGQASAGAPIDALGRRTIGTIGRTLSLLFSICSCRCQTVGTAPCSRTSCCLCPGTFSDCTVIN
jgi:hypothetical protein